MQILQMTSTGHDGVRKETSMMLDEPVLVESILIYLFHVPQPHADAYIACNRRAWCLPFKVVPPDQCTDDSLCIQVQM